MPFNNGVWAAVILVQVAPLSLLTCHWCAVAILAIVVKLLLLVLVAVVEVTKFEVEPVPANVLKVPVAVFVFLSISWAVVGLVIDVFVAPASPWLKL